MGPNDIEIKNPIRDNDDDKDPIKKPEELGDEQKVIERTEVNQELEEVVGNDPADGDTTTRLEEISEGSVDEHMPANSESAEDKVQDIINSGILKM